MHTTKSRLGTRSQDGLVRRSGPFGRNAHRRDRWHVTLTARHRRDSIASRVRNAIRPSATRRSRETAWARGQMIVIGLAVLASLARPFADTSGCGSVRKSGS